MSSNKNFLAFKWILYSTILLCIFSGKLNSQTLTFTDCPTVDKRSNGNGQASLAAGDFRPAYSQNNRVAPNVEGTIYQKVSYDPATKTGNINLKWTSPATATVVNAPVITRLWITSTASVTSLSNAVFGPPPLVSNTVSPFYVNYCFYVQNIPNQGVFTLEFANPQTGGPARLCSYDIATGAPATNPTISCLPTISSQPQTQVLCDNGSVTFSCTSAGTSTFQWQYSSNSGSTWNNISLGGDYTTVTKDILTFSNRLSYTGNQYRVLLTNSCGTATSTAAQLTVNTKPTAVFSGASSLCGLNITRSLGINLTGSSPWNLIYSVNGVNQSLSGITSNPYFISVSPSVTTTYSIVSISDSKCNNAAPTGSITLIVSPTPSVSPVSSSACVTNNSFNLSYTASATANRYSITAGVRSLSGFSAVSNASLLASPLSITIPTTGITAGVYDFNMVVSNSTSGCVSLTMPFTLTLQAIPVITASSDKSSICSGTTVTLTAVGANSYTWTSSPAGFSSSSASASVAPTISTIYSVSGTGANGCASSSTLNINVNSAPSLSISATATTVCPGNQISLTASGGNLYSWAGPSSYTASGASIIITPTVAGTYTLTGTSQNGCIGTLTQSISIGSGTSPTITPSSATICAGASNTLTVVGANTYIWAPSSGLSATTGTSTIASPTTSTTYTVYGTSNGCTSTKTINVTVSSSPVTSVSSSDIFYCSSDLNSGTKSLDLSIATSSNQSFTWYDSPDGVTYSAVSTGGGSRYSITGVNPTTSSVLNYKNPFGNNQFIKVEFTSNSCTYSYKMNLSTFPTATPTISANQSICSGTSPDAIKFNSLLTLGNSAKTDTLAWQVSTTSNSTGFSNIAGSTQTTTSSINGSSYQPGVLSQNTWYRLKISSNSSNCAGPFYSNTVAITIGASITNNTLSVSDACGVGSQITGSTPTGGNGIFTYAWEASTTSSVTGFSTVVGETSQNYTPPTPTVTTWYRRLVSSGSCSNSSSSAIAIHPPLLNGQISNGQTICSGSSLSILNVSPTGGDSGGSYTYLWYSSSNNVDFSSTGAATSTYTPSNSVGTNYYRVVVTKGVCTYTSNSAFITVNASPTLSISATSSLVCQGNTSDLTVSGASTYTWSPSTYLSSTSGAFVTSTPTAAISYTVTGTTSAGCAASSASISVAYATPPVTPSVSVTNTTICNDATPFNLSNLVTPSDAQWFSAPSASSSYSIANLVSSAGTYYVFSKSGNCYSNIPASVVLSIDDVTAPVLSASLSSVCSPASVDLTAFQPVPSSGTILEWHTGNTSGSSVVSTPSSVSSGTYYLFAKSSVGLCYGSSSSGFSVTINPLPSVTSLTTSLQTCAPGSVDLTSAISNTAGVTTQWYSSNANPPDASNLVSQPTVVNQSGTYYSFAFNNSTSCVSASSASVAVTINPMPTLSLASSETYTTSGNPITMSVSITNTISSPSYQWAIYDNSGWHELQDTARYSGSTSSVLSISSNTGLDGKAYRCKVTSNTSCYDYSSIAVLGIDNSSALPIELISFVGVNDGVYNRLFWSTATEKNNALFTVEKSSDGVNFVKLADIQSKGENGNSLFKLDYQTLDYAPFDNITYYRLKQTDFNGAFDISNMIAVWSNKKQTPSFSVYPNPTTGEITISTNQLLPKGTKIEIINHLGQKVNESSFFNQSLESKMIMNEEFKNGLYFIIIKSDDHILFKDGLIKQ